MSGHVPADIQQLAETNGIRPRASFGELCERIEALEVQQADVARRITEAVDMVKPYLDGVLPYIERFCNTPVGKMLGMGTTKK